MESTNLQIEKIKENAFPILIGTTIFLLTITLFRSTLLNYFKLKSENDRLEQKLAVLKRKSQLLQSLDRNEIERRVKKLEEVFPSEKPVINLIASLNQISQQEGVTFRGIQLEPGRIVKYTSEEGGKQADLVTNELQDFTINFNIQGKLSAVTSFISRLEKAAPLMKIESLSLSLDGSNCSLAVRVYYQTLPEILGVLDKPVPLLTENEKEILNEIATYQKVELIKTTVPVGKANIFALP